MLADVLAATARAELVERVIVVTGEGRAERIALRHAQRAATPLEVLREPEDRGHSEAATLGIIRAKALGAECVALLPGDCPLLDPAELDAALERMRERPRGGRPRPPRHRHQRAPALAARRDRARLRPGQLRPSRRPRPRRPGHAVAVERLDSLALDLDTPDDLAALAAALEREPDRAPATAAELARAGRLGRGAHG